jgi:hypothetical protein
MTALVSGGPASEGLGGTRMVLRDGITGITGMTWLRGGPRNFLIALSGRLGIIRRCGLAAADAS